VLAKVLIQEKVAVVAFAAPGTRAAQPTAAARASAAVVFGVILVFVLACITVVSVVFASAGPHLGDCLTTQPDGVKLPTEC
jgi:hypothetical protein